MRPATDSGPLIAIVGRGCRLPMADDLNQYWRLIADGHCAQQPLPEQRLDRQLLFDPRPGRLGSTYADFACTVRYPQLDTPACRLPHPLKRHPERTYATLAQTAFEAVDDAGLDPLDLPSRNVGVFVGHTRASGLAGDKVFANYIGQVASLVHQIPSFSEALGDRLETFSQRLVEDVRGDYPDSVAGPSGAGQCSRALAEALAVSGPQMTFNAACASSTQALAQAVRALQVGRCDFTVAAGASYCHADTLVLFSKAQSLSPSGTRPLDADADGLVLGEGYVTLLLCRLDDARRLGLPVRAIVEAVGLSSDGKGKSLWAPRRQGQVLAIRRAYADSAAYRQVGYIEAHATSTQLGDATEMQALAECFAPHLPAGRRIPVGSVKANIGHTLETAGIAGVLKCLLAMQHETIPAMGHIDRPNPKIDWQRVPLQLPPENQPWGPHDRGWTAAVNAFGIGGLNTHLVLRRPLPVAPKGRQANPPAAAGSGDVRAAALPAAAVPVAAGPMAVIGVGAILPGAIGADAAFELLRSGRSALTRLDDRRWSPQAYPQGGSSPWSVRSRMGGVVTGYEFDWRRHRIPPKQVAHASPLQFMILDAVEQAVQMAGVEMSEVVRQRCGVVVGTSFGGEFANQLQMGLRLPELRRRLARLLDQAGVSIQQRDQLIDRFAAKLLEDMPALLDETGSFTSSSLASRVTKSLDLMGGAVAVDSGNTAFGSALTCCVDQLACGDNDLMICVGAQQDLGPSRFVGMTRSGQLGDASGTDGIFPAEGAVAVVLQRLPDARRVGQAILAVIDSVGAGFDPRTQSRSIEQAICQAWPARQRHDGRGSGGVTGAAGHVECASSGQAAAERQAAAALSWGFRSFGAEPAELRLHDASRQVGHLAGGSMAVSLLAALARLQHRPAQAAGHQSTTPQPPAEHWVLGGSPGECIQAIFLRSP